MSHIPPQGGSSCPSNTSPSPRVQTPLLEKQILGNAPASIPALFQEETPGAPNHQEQISRDFGSSSPLLGTQPHLGVLDHPEHSNQGLDPHLRG